MSLPILISNRLTKLVGNLVKGLGYIFHLLLPKTRFTIPEYSAPLFKSKDTQKIPKILWQTNYTNKVSLPMYINYLFNRLMSYNYEYRYASDEAILTFFDEHASIEETTAYKKLNDGAAKADFWRVTVLYHIGGVYLDIDAALVWPLSKLIHTDDTELFIKNKLHYTNYFLATAPKNDVFEKGIAIIVDNIKHKRIAGGAYAMTGPEIINSAIDTKEVHTNFYRYVCTQGAFTNEYFHYIDKKQGKWIHTNDDDLLND